MQRLTTKEKAIILAKELTKGIEKLQLPYSTLNEALTMAQEIIGKKLGRKFSPKAFAASILYLACKEQGYPILLKEICYAMGLNKKEMKRALLIYSTITQKIRKISKPSVNKYVERLVDLLGLGEKVKERAIQIVEDAKEKGLVAGRNPVSIAAAAVYYACKKLRIAITQKEIAAKAFITEATLRNRYKEIKELLGDNEVHRSRIKGSNLLLERA
ncbi:MAG TPA: transcription initiation factor IIB family protein [Geobacterales bacterium]|nr:transcription initiation factor IIB family protein [Geobacterales bacterium]